MNIEYIELNDTLDGLIQQEENIINLSTDSNKDNHNGSRHNKHHKKH